MQKSEWKESMEIMGNMILETGALGSNDIDRLGLSGSISPQSLGRGGSMDASQLSDVWNMDATVGTIWKQFHSGEKFAGWREVKANFILGDALTQEDLLDLQGKSNVEIKSKARENPQTKMTHENASLGDASTQEYF